MIRSLLYGLALAAIALNGLRSAVDFLHSVKAAGYWPASADWLTRFDEELGQARPYIAGRREIAYVTSIPNEKLMTIGYAEQTARYFIAQYALAPAVLSRTPGPPIVFADFPEAAALRDFAKRNRYSIVWENGGTGILKIELR